MKKKILCPSFVFIGVLLFHGIYLVWEGMQVSKQWVQIEEATPLRLYFERQDYFIGISYALAGAFTVCAFLKYLDGLRSGTAGVIGGLTLTGVLYFAGCFLLGCCGSPMLVLYVSLFGSSFMDFAKPLTMTITAVSVIIGFVWLEKKTKASNGCCNTQKGVSYDRQRSD